jgi:hypothetical protein
VTKRLRVDREIAASVPKGIQLNITICVRGAKEHMELGNRFGWDERVMKRKLVSQLNQWVVEQERVTECSESERESVERCHWRRRVDF